MKKNHQILLKVVLQDASLCLTHIPGTDEDGNHVWLVLVGMFVLHQLQQLTKCLPLLKKTHTQTSEWKLR